MNKMKNKLRRIGVASVAMLVFIASSNTCMMKVRATELSENNYATEKHFSEERDNYGYIDKKISNDIANNTGVISPKLEEYLNSEGFFDEDINCLTDEEIQSLKDIEKEDIEVYTEYYAVVDEGNTSITEDELIPLNSDEVNELIKEEYYGKKSDLNKKIHNRMNRKESKSKKDFLELIGIKPIVVYASDSYTIGGVNDKVNYSYLKKSLFAVKSKFYYYNADNVKKYYYQIIATMTWSKMPENRLWDIFSIEWEGMSYEYPSTSERKNWTEQGVNLSPQVMRIYDTETFWINKNSTNKEPYNYTYKYNITKDMTCKAYGNDKEVTLKNNQYYLRSDKMVGVVDLLDDKSVAYDSGKIKYTNYTNEGVKIIMYLKKQGDNTGRVYLMWKHTQKKVKLNLDISLDRIVSLTISIAESNPIMTVLTLAGGVNGKTYYTYTNAGKSTNNWIVNFK
ncbi:MAG: hypothetical protein E7270_10585 [Lachnospiraceae bacterium]|nr:hypothetical protein [Lachnospiraceae bacterium]MBQ4069321.1 hypothetical protein [Lachnospiraceae bacterium]